MSVNTPISFQLSPAISILAQNNLSKYRDSRRLGVKSIWSRRKENWKRGKKKKEEKSRNLIHPEIKSIQKPFEKMV